jgi:hypothetical protein
VIVRPTVLAAALWLALGSACGAAATVDATVGTPTGSGDDDDSPDDDDAPDDDDDDDPAPIDDDASDETGTSGTQTSGDGTTGTAGCEPAPDPDPAWLDGYLDEVVMHLSVTIGERSTPTQRSATAQYLEQAFEGLGYAPQLHGYPGGTNVYAQLPATEGEVPVLVIGAHYDTVPGSPGANDNATGVALVLAMARYLREIACRDRNVIFVAFDQEEIGLVGSDAFARFLVDLAVDVEGVHTIDQMGWDADGDRKIELERADPGLFEFYAGPAAALVPPVVLTPTDTGFTDHVSFRAHGLPAVGLTEEYVTGDTTPHYHLPSDAYETVDLAFTASTAVLANLAFADWVDAS